jgi:dihydrofolate reductase
MLIAERDRRLDGGRAKSRSARRRSPIGVASMSRRASRFAPAPGRLAAHWRPTAVGWPGRRAGKGSATGHESQRSAMSSAMLVGRSLCYAVRPITEGVAMPRTRVHNMNISLDGYAAGELVTFDAPIGGAERLFTWFDGRVIHGVDKADAPVTLDRALTSMWSQGIGAEIMGRRKFGPQVGDWPDDGWRGWWGDEPPFQTPVFVLSHHPHPPIDFPNGTSFRFVDGSPHEVLRLAQEAANGRDVRIGGGPSTVRQFLQADLVDFMHLVIVPITLGRGVSLWEGSSGIEDRFTVEAVTSPSGLTHQLWNKNDHV